MNTLLNKLRSRRGASITFGLFIFLICVVISTVVIVAATTSAGRISGMAKAEQRYYSVTSTAKVIQELMKDGKVTVITYTDGDSTKTYIMSDNGSQATEIGKASLDTLPKYVVSTICNNDGGTHPLTLSSSTAALSKAISEVTVEESVSAGDNVTFKVSNNDFKFILKFATNKSSSPIEIDSGDESIEAYRTVYTWTLSSAGTR